MAKTALVTGASSGIGMALATIFARENYDLVLVSQNETNLSRAEAELRSINGSNRILAISVDLSQPKGAEEVYEKVAKNAIRIDVLVNNAGVQVYGNFHEVSPKETDRLLYLNMNALVRMTGLFLPDMIRKGGGKILNLASAASFQPCPLNAAYCASKAFVLHFSEGIGEELRGAGVTVTALCPGATQTNFITRGNIQGTGYFKGRISSAEEVAAEGYKALMKGKAVHIVGTKNRFLAFTVRLMPRSLVLKIGNRMMRKQT